MFLTVFYYVWKGILELSCRIIVFIYMYNFSTVMAVFIAFVCVYFHFSLKILQLNRILDPIVEMFGDD